MRSSKEIMIEEYDDLEYIENISYKQIKSIKANQRNNYNPKKQIIRNKRKEKIRRTEGCL